MRGEKSKAAAIAANDGYTDYFGEVEEDEDEECQGSICMDGAETEDWSVTIQEKIAQLAVIHLTTEEPAIEQTPESSKPHSPRVEYQTPPATARTSEIDILSPERTVCHTVRTYDTWDDDSHSGDDGNHVVRMMVKMPKPTKSTSSGSQASSDTYGLDSATWRRCRP